MANNPVTRHVLKYKGGGNVQVFPNLPTMLNGTQDGSDLGTGGPALATVAPSLPAGSFVANRNIEFLDDRYALSAHGPGSLTSKSGVYKKNQGGAGQWGRVRGGEAAGDTSVDGNQSGLHVLHPGGVPTLAYLYFDGNSELKLNSTVDGTTGANWAAGVGLLLETITTAPVTTGQSIVFRNSIVWAHQYFTTGGAGTGELTQYDLVSQTVTRYNIQSIFRAGTACEMGLHVHDGILYAMNRGPAANSVRLAKLLAGSWSQVWQSGLLSVGGSGSLAHHAMFTDPSTGDLIGLISGSSQSQVWRFTDPAGTVTPLQISSTVMGATEGANKYLVGGGSASTDRRFSIFVDTETAPATPRTYITTWLPAGSTETWEWKGVGAEMEAVSGLGGISDDFALPYGAYGGGHRSPRIAAIEIGDASSAPLEVIGGTKFFFRGRGSAAVGIVTFRGTDTENAPSTIVPIVAASLTIESGAPATTPTISGNTLINFTPDNGATLYSVVLETSAAGVDISEGDVGIIIPTLV